jgi:hypothetical protein
MTDSSSNALIDALGLDELSPEQQEELLLELNEVIFRGSLVRLIERMDESAKADFAELMQKDPSEAEVSAFLAERVPDADQAVAETVADLTDDILSVSQQ